MAATTEYLSGRFPTGFGPGLGLTVKPAFLSISSAASKDEPIGIYFSINADMSDLLLWVDIFLSFIFLYSASISFRNSCPM